MSSFDYNKAIDMAVQLRKLEQHVEAARRYFMRTMLAIATAMPDGELRIAKVDYQRARRRVLATFVDPATGDRVFVSKPMGQEDALDDCGPQL